jgi:hypothetical protein
VLLNTITIRAILYRQFARSSTHLSNPEEAASGKSISEEEAKLNNNSWLRFLVKSFPGFLACAF